MSKHHTKQLQSTYKCIQHLNHVYEQIPYILIFQKLLEKEDEWHNAALSM